MLEHLKDLVYTANMELPRRNLVTYTWGNVSGIDRDSGLVVIKPSGVEYAELKPSDMVVVDLDGRTVEGRYKPSSDTPTHLVLYNAYGCISGIVHTHSTWATMWAQAERAIPCFGTTHADYFHGPIPCSRSLEPDEIGGLYEYETGMVIKETIGTQADEIPGVLVAGHGPFAWGADPLEAVHNAVVMEEVAKMAFGTVMLNPSQGDISKCLLDRHYLRKHGANAYYGQKG